MKPQPHYQRISAPKELRPYIRRYLYTENHVDVDVTIAPAPTGSAYLGYTFSGTVSSRVDNAHHSSKSGLYLSCPIDRRQFDVTYKGPVGEVLVEFTATGFYRLFGIPLSRLSHMHHDAADILEHATTSRFLASLSEATTIEERISAFNHLFSNLAEEASEPVRHVDLAVSLIEQNNGMISIAEICDRAMVTERTLLRCFKHVVGLTPKLYSRAVQMSMVMGEMLSRPHKSIAELADEFGYCNEAHLIKSMNGMIYQSPKMASRTDNRLLHVFMGQSEFRRNAWRNEQALYTGENALR